MFWALTVSAENIRRHQSIEYKVFLQKKKVSYKTLEN